MTRYAVGDLQGCLKPLQCLLTEVDFKPEHDQLWCVGDLINRGPQSLQTLRYLKTLSDQHPASLRVVLGNHDLHLLAIAHGLRKRGKHDTLDELLVAPDRAELLEWLRHQPLLHRDKDLGWSMLHAGLPPQWSIKKALKNAAKVEKQLRGENYLNLLQNMYGNEPDRWSSELRKLPRWRFTINCLTRMRYITPKGVLDFQEKLAPGHQADGLIPWFKAKKPKWAGSNIVAGHWSTIGAARNGSVYHLDSGCVWGGCLTALQIDTPQPKKPQFISVSCDAGE